jgi:hypothetical protein
MPLELALGVSPHNPLMRLMNFCLAVATKFLPGLLGYQCMFAVRPKA